MNKKIKSINLIVTILFLWLGEVNGQDRPYYSGLPNFEFKTKSKILREYEINQENQKNLINVKILNSNGFISEEVDFNSHTKYYYEYDEKRIKRIKLFYYGKDTSQITHMSEYGYFYNDKNRFEKVICNETEQNKLCTETRTEYYYYPNNLIKKELEYFNDSLHYEAQYYYDTLYNGNIIQKKVNDNIETLYTYDKYGHLLEEKDDRYFTCWIYDSNFRKIIMTQINLQEFESEIIVCEYNKGGLITKETTYYQNKKYHEMSYIFKQDKVKKIKEDIYYKDKIDTRYYLFDW